MDVVGRPRVTRQDVSLRHNKLGNGRDDRCVKMRQRSSFCPYFFTLHLLYSAVHHGRLRIRVHKDIPSTEMSSVHPLRTRVTQRIFLCF